MSHSGIENELQRVGWASVNTDAKAIDSVGSVLTRIASLLGEIAPGRNGLPFEEVVPEAVETARAGSLSSRFGLSPLPLHTDTAHWSVPCRFLVLACVNPGPAPTPTFLFDSSAATLSESETSACRSAVFAIKNGRSSFYGSIVERGRPFIRCDPGCMVALSREGALALDTFSIERHVEKLQRHQWTVGNILVLDNWRVLHARGYNAPTLPGRMLLRAMVR